MDEQTRHRLTFTNSLLFETPGGLRFTQDSPILPNVWLAFAENPRSQQELILTSSQDGGTGQAALKIREMLNNFRVKKQKNGMEIGRRPRVSYIPGQIAVKLYFDELMRVVLPHTHWWHETYDKLRRLEHTMKKPGRVADWYDFPQPDPKGREKDLYEALMLMRREIGSGHQKDQSAGNNARQDYIRQIPPDLTWFVRIAGLIANCFEHGHDMLSEEDSLAAAFERDFAYRRREREDPDLIENSEDQRKREEAVAISTRQAQKARRDVASAFTGLFWDWSPNSDYPSDRLIWRITKNRPVRLAVNDSAMTIKADAAVRLFDISCEKVTWAVVDSGIDKRHHAFKLLTPEQEKLTREALAEEGQTDELYVGDMPESRVIKTLDFTRLRELLDYDIEIDKGDPKARKNRKEVIAEIARRMPKEKGVNNRQKAISLLRDLSSRIRSGKDVSWQDLEAAIVDHDPQPPENDHGTHVAGILGADWIDGDLHHERNLPLKERTRQMQGVCPDINIIDVRVFRNDGLTDEFELLAAMQYLRWMNSRAGTMQVHGANLSLSLIHEVRRFACGQTPICEECNEAVAAGMVVVAAAGNRGFEMTDFEEIRSTDSYKSVSITDPGNAHSVITVGATHRKRPHEYGVSYFSSRGPTGDGRFKPDLVAPGEKISGPTPDNRIESKDGTSMAAPHVSGAAALLMARNSELIAQPERVKRILCDTATDLDRERYFQGAGLVDILRALQSV